MLVLENLAHRFIRANILELKIGNQLQDLSSALTRPPTDQQRSTLLQVHLFSLLLFLNVYV